VKKEDTMATFFTKDFFKTYADARQVQSRNWLNESKNFGQRSDAKFDIFLSHSFKNKEEVKGVYIYLTDIGYRVYVDWIVDPELDRSEVNSATVQNLRKRMKQSACLIYAVSDQAASSKWMPWELGFMDGFTDHRCAVLPVLDVSTDSFSGQEFIHVYPTITKEDLANGNFRIIVKSSGKLDARLFEWQKPTGVASTF
jgi:hypothetical protein